MGGWGAPALTRLQLTMTKSTSSPLGGYACNATDDLTHYTVGLSIGKQWLCPCLYTENGTKSEVLAQTPVARLAALHMLCARVSSPASNVAFPLNDLEVAYRGTEGV